MSASDATLSRRATRRAASRGRSRSPAGCCRAPCATTSTGSTSCSACSTTSSTSAIPRRPSGSPPSRRGARAAPACTQETEILAVARRAARPAARGAARLLPRDARRPRGDADPDRGGARHVLLPRRRDGGRGHDGDPRHAPGVAVDEATAAAALGKAMQRTNILRDIDEDMGNGRIYLAMETVERFGSLEPGRREALLRDQIARADALYDEGVAGIGPLRERPHRDPRRRRDVPRDPAPDRARGLRRAGRPRRRPAVPQAVRRRARGDGVASPRVRRLRCSRGALVARPQMAYGRACRARWREPPRAGSSGSSWPRRPRTR